MPKKESLKRQAHEREFSLDLLRCFAIFPVLLMHVAFCVPGLPPALARVFYEGWVGVDLFFVLSGYLIGSQLHGKKHGGAPGGEIGAFWRRRWTRTLPLYFVVLFVYVVVKPLLFHAPFMGEPWRFVFFVQNFHPISDFAQSWSLCIEEQFYLFIPILFFALLRTRLSPWLWAGFWLLSPLLRFLQWRELGLPFWNGGQMPVPDFDLRFRFHTLAHLDGLAAGVFLSSTRDHWRAWPRLRKRVLAFVGAILVVGGVAWCSYAPADLRAVFLFSILSLGFASLLIGLHGLEASSILIRLPVEKIALWSYGAYLWNQLVVRLLVRFPVEAHWLLGALLFLLLTHLISFATYHFVEKPGLRLRG
ncbi:MAG TPA: acyltransferase [Bdellovibrionota bacterium]|jgi:peptidoglycan/LPS O-acetylase OafA/YrhL